MTAWAVSASGIGKGFRTYRSEWQRLASWFGASVAPATQHWVLRDITFEVARGEAIGIVGQNGAGKSTLLKLIAGTLQPNAGILHINGRAAAILELGTGFNPELTGRQNVFHTGGLMGASRDALQQAMPAIESFADIGEYFDQPVRIYSSGMQLRAAFAVATAFRPDVLIIDEAMSVGDAAFQRKCFRRIEDFRSSGTTLLFVSHDLETIRRVCARALYLAGGRLVRIGPAKEVCEEYERQLFGHADNPGAARPSVARSAFDPSLAGATCIVYGSGQAEIRDCSIENEAGLQVNVIESGQPFVWRYVVRFIEPVDDPIFAMLLKTREGVTIYGVDSSRLRSDTRRRYLAGDEVEVRFDLVNWLAPGMYFFNCGVRLDREDRVDFVCRHVDAALIKVTARPTVNEVAGVVDMDARLSLSIIDSGVPI